MARIAHFLPVFCFLFLSSAAFSQTKYPLGLDIEDEAYENIPVKAILTRTFYLNVPDKYSLRPYCPPVGRQTYSDCVGWANSYSARSVLFNKKYNRRNNPAAFSPIYVHRSVVTSCSATAATEDALAFMRDYGTIPNTILAYNCMTNAPDDSLKNIAKHFRITEYERLFSKDETNTYLKNQQVKKALAEGKPVVIGMEIYQSFMDADGKEMWQAYSNDNKVGTHAMVVIGYDNNKSGGAFEIMNSWGDKWGDKGFIWVKYEDFGKYVKRAYTLSDSETGQDIAYDRIVNPSAATPVVVATHTPPVVTTGIPPITPPKPAPSTTTAFAGNVRLVALDNKEIPIRMLNKNSGSGSSTRGAGYTLYTTQNTYKTGKEFRIYVQNSTPAYVYVFGMDASKEVSCLFPASPQVSAWMDYSKNEIALPGEDQFIYLTEPAGEDWICVLFSKNKLKTEMVQQALQNTQGSALERVRSIFGETCIQPSEITYDATQAGFQAQLARKAVVPVLLRIQHVE